MKDLFASETLGIQNKEKDPHRNSSIEEKALLLGLYSVEGIGWKTLRQIYRSYLLKGHEVFNTKRLASLLCKAKTRNYDRLALKIATTLDDLRETGLKEYEKLQKEGIDLLVYNELPPINLGEQPLYWLFVQGNKELLHSDTHLSVAIIGTRKPAPEAKDHIKRLAWVLSNYPVATVSGLADGVDYWAHSISLEYNLKTIAFLGHGLYVYTSAASKSLRERIVQEGGTVVSEYFLKERHNRDRFLRRNKLIASFSDITIPIQADVPGGTYSTVVYALKFNKNVIGLEMENSSIVNFLRKNGCILLNTAKKSDIVYFDKLIKDIIRDKKIEFNIIASLKTKIKNFIEAELSYRYVDKEYCNKISQLFEELRIEIKDQLEGRCVDKGVDYSSRDNLNTDRRRN